MNENNQYIVTISEDWLCPGIEEAEAVLVPAAYQCCDGMVLVTQACDWEKVKQFFFLTAEEDREEREKLIEKLTLGRSYKALDYYTFDCNSEDYESGILENDPACRGVEIDLMRVDSCEQMLEGGYVPPRNASELMKNDYFSNYFSEETRFIHENIERVQAEIDKLEGRKFFWIYEAGILYSH